MKALRSIALGILILLAVPATLRAQSNDIESYALLAVGGATLAGGVTWWAVGQPSTNGQPAQAMLGVAGKF